MCDSVYKSGPAWKVARRPETQGIHREPRTVYHPNIEPFWEATLKKIISRLDELEVQFTCVNAFAWANEGDEKPFCDLLVSVGVTPRSLAYELAVSASKSLKIILASIGLATVEVAFVEQVVTRRAGGPALLPLDPVAHNVHEYRKPFSNRLGLPIALLDAPYYEGTGGLYLKNADDILLLTCAHVTRPPPLFNNTGMKRTNNNQPKENIVALGAGAYSRVVSDMIAEIAKITRDIDTFTSQLGRSNLPEDRRTAITRLNTKRVDINALHTEITKFRSTPELRIVGWVVYSSVIEADAKVSGEELGYTQDWGLVQLDPKMLDLKTFEGNKLYFGTLHLAFLCLFRLSAPTFSFCRTVCVVPFAITLLAVILSAALLFVYFPVTPFFRYSNRTLIFVLCSRRRPLHPGRPGPADVAQSRGPSRL